MKRAHTDTGQQSLAVWDFLDLRPHRTLSDFHFTLWLVFLCDWSTAVVASRQRNSCGISAVAAAAGGHTAHIHKYTQTQSRDETKSGS